MKKQDLQSLVQECISEVLEERKKKSKGDDEFKRVDKGVKGKVAKDKGEEEVYGAGYAAGEKAAKSKYKKLAEAFYTLKEEKSKLDELDLGATMGMSPHELEVFLGGVGALFGVGVAALVGIVKDIKAGKIKSKEDVKNALKDDSKKKL